MTTITERTEPMQPRANQGSAGQPTVTDALGRTITLRRLSTLNKMRLFEIIGPANADNGPYLGYATIACHVAAIDGDPVHFPSSKLQLEAIVSRLDDGGIAAVSAGIAEHFMTQTAEEIIEAAKNG